MSPHRPAEGLFPIERWTKRRHEIAADRVLRQLKGADWDKRRDLAASSLRAAARATDIAEYIAMTEPAPYAAQTLAQCAKELRETLQLWGLGMGGSAGDNAFEELVASMAGEAPTASGDTPPA